MIKLILLDINLIIQQIKQTPGAIYRLKLFILQEINK